jgi:hypothetical protein
VGKVPAREHWPLYPEVASTVVNRYSRTIVEEDVWQNEHGYVAVLLPGSFDYTVPLLSVAPISPYNQLLKTCVSLPGKPQHSTKARGLSPQEFMSSQFWRLKVWDRVSSEASLLGLRMAALPSVSSHGLPSARVCDLSSSPIPGT